MNETRTWNEERYGYDVEGPCWCCGSPIRYFVDEDGTPRDITPLRDQYAANSATAQAGSSETEMASST